MMRRRAILKRVDDLQEVDMVRGLFVASLTASSLMLSILVGAAQAQTAPADTEQGRFSFHKVDEGFLRLDTRSGQVSLCNHKSLGWACETIPDERSALENEIARLQNGNAALKKELLSRGLALPESVKPEPPLAKNSDKNDLELKLPSQADIDRVMTFMERVWRRMVEAANNLQKDLQGKI
jgi:hypothetical protein